MVGQVDQAGFGQGLNQQINIGWVWLWFEQHWDVKKKHMIIFKIKVILIHMLQQKNVTQYIKIAKIILGRI